MFGCRENIDGKENGEAAGLDERGHSYTQDPRAREDKDHGNRAPTEAERGSACRLFGALTRVVLSFDSMIRSHLAQANRYIAEMRADIARERVIVEYALDAGYPSEVAESMLHALEGALRIFEKHRELVLDQLKRRPSE